jgi:hypothetical protein
MPLEQPGLGSKTVRTSEMAIQSDWRIAPEGWGIANLPIGGLVGARRFELRTSSLSGTRSNQLSYAPEPVILQHSQRLSNPVGRGGDALALGPRTTRPMTRWRQETASGSPRNGWAAAMQPQADVPSAARSLREVDFPPPTVATTDKIFAIRLSSAPKWAEIIGCAYRVLPARPALRCFRSRNERSTTSGVRHADRFAGISPITHRPHGGPYGFPAAEEQGGQCPPYKGLQHRLATGVALYTGFTGRDLA